MSTRRSVVVWLPLLLVVAGGPSMAVERAKYAVELNDPPYEIRDYAPSLVASVHVDGNRGEAVSAGFRILANYIFGGNQPKGKIAMTAPVAQQPTPGGWEVRFTMPAAYTLNTLPAPADPRVHIAAMPAHRAAVISFSGFWSDTNLLAHEAKLLEWLKTQQLTATSVPTYDYYDPPWTPWFLRTIEVAVDIARRKP
jgi:hypothetical protein